MEKGFQHRFWVCFEIGTTVEGSSFLLYFCSANSEELVGDSIAVTVATSTTMTEISPLGAMQSYHVRVLWAMTSINMIRIAWQLCNKLQAHVYYILA